jgi:hypothetical protein
MRNRILCAAFAVLTGLAMSAAWITTSCARKTDFKEKPPMYSFIAVWNIPRDQWEARENQAAAARKILERAVADGTIAAYGFDRNPLHDTFWLSMSREGLASVRDEFREAGIAAVPSSTAGDTPFPASILVSRYYNWHGGTWENAYVHVGIYTMKSDATPDAVDALSRNFFAPPLEKMLSDGAIFEWETDTYDSPRDGPRTFLIAYLSETAEGLDKANDAVQESLKSRPPTGRAFDSLVDPSANRDVVLRSYAVYR